jgi:hypothetical protein
MALRLDDPGMNDQLERVQRLLKKVTYKPGWIITAYPHQMFDEPRSEDRYRFHNETRIVIRVVCLQPDTISGQPREFIHHRSLCAYDIAHLDDSKIIEYFIGRAIVEMEMHEVDEWFKYDGSHVKDPHPEKNKF